MEHQRSKYPALICLACVRHIVHQCFIMCKVDEYPLKEPILSVLAPVQESLKSKIGEYGYQALILAIRLLYSLSEQANRNNLKSEN
ncbi:hypothetical protein FGO68_gene9528 [Halteria grandinella]|uniref:Uncharacterized protein n=1 Tax=Halteria grandinella TaxID=5974 RepID=A0A8J8NE73_HALGN|nr:hypothetical protein FGO68_gene9528 [Halteria grandinella]